MSKVYLAISNDKYELPLALFECVDDWRVWSGRSGKNTFYNELRKGMVDHKNNCRYVKVVLDE